MTTEEEERQEEERLQRIKDGLMRDYFKGKPYDQYVVGVACSIVKIQDPEAKEGLDDICMVVYLKEPLPNGLKIPREREGIKVYTIESGEFSWP